MYIYSLTLHIYSLFSFFDNFPFYRKNIKFSLFIFCILFVLFISIGKLYLLFSKTIWDACNVQRAPFFVSAHLEFFAVNLKHYSVRLVDTNSGVH